MSSFSCQYIDSKEDCCMRLKVDCVPGRPGCVLYGKVEFAVSAKQRIEKKLNDQHNSFKEKYRKNIKDSSKR